MGNDFPLFDPSHARGASDKPDVGKSPPKDDIAPAKRDDALLSVSALLGRIKGAINDAFPKSVSVVAELSNVKRHGSGHIYFSLKDASATIDAVMFRGRASRLKFDPVDGLEVVVTGRVDIYDVRGQLQLYVERMTPRGAGALELAFRQLRQKLEAEGLFDPASKKPIPTFPRAIGVVTSDTGAAVRDISRTLRRRWPAAQVYLVGVRVQGDQAAGEIAEAIGLLDAAAKQYNIDTILVGRGGGSLEDLWAFNEEAVARAIFAAETPIISGIGHDEDITIADLVADLRAPTPTGAAELAVPNAADIAEHVAQLSGRLRRTMTDRCERARVALDAILRSVVFRDPTARLRTQSQRLDELSHRLGAGCRHQLAEARSRLHPRASRLASLHPARLAEHARGRLERATHRLQWVLGARSKRAGEALSASASRLGAAHPRHRLALAQQKVSAIGRQLESMSHRNVLKRGFSVTRLAGGGILRSVEAVGAGKQVETELADGRFTSTVDGRKTRPDATAPAGKQSNEIKPTLFE